MTVYALKNENDELIRSHLLDQHQRHGNFRTQCPICGPSRTKSSDRCLSVRMDGSVAVWICHHCEEKGSTELDNGNTFEIQDYIDIVTDTVTPQANTVEKLYGGLTDEQYGYLTRDRGISADTADRCGLVSKKLYIKKREAEVLCIGFQYNNLDGTTATKWRDGIKNFSQTGAAKDLWRIDQFPGGDLVITEGEMDALSFEEIGIFATSVPNGATQRVSDEIDSTSKKYMYLHNADKYLKDAKRIIIASDADSPGQCLAEEIVRRIGKSRCWRMQYPDDCKDANDVLRKHGREALKECVSNATPWPIGGLRQATEYEEQAVQLFRDGMDHAIDPGVGELGQIFRPAPGTLAVFTGIPGSGKSTFTTWMSYLLASKHDWPCAVFSAETSSQVHLLQLAALHVGKDFKGKDKMTETQLRDAIHWISDRFVFLDESETSVESILERAQAAIMRNGCRLLVIDPFNFISGGVSRGDDEGSTFAINKILVALKTFAVEHDIAVWLVAHPKKMERFQGTNQTPKGYDIAGSAHFFNVADYGITLERDPELPRVARVITWKVRFDWYGSLGTRRLQIDNVGKFDKVREWGSNPGDWDVNI